MPLDQYQAQQLALRRQGMTHTQSSGQTDPALEAYMAAKESPTKGVPLEAPMLSPDDLIGTGLLSKAGLVTAALMGGIKSVGKKAPRSAASHFNVGDAAETRFKSRSKLIDMPISDFLKMAEYTAGSPEKAATVKSVLESGKKFDDLPYLNVDAAGKVYGHEGRHRAMELQNRGYDTMPVQLHNSNIRWSEQTDPTRFDYRPEWPEFMTGETSGRIPFPVSRENAAANYPMQSLEVVGPQHEAIATATGTLAPDLLAEELRKPQP